MCFFIVYFFFFKQKTAYEIVSGDWSSDVCSSDLQVLGRYGSAQVLLKPAGEGTGVIAGGPVRKVMQVAGITNVLTKSIGTSNPHNVVKATFAALLGLKDIAHVAATRSKTVEEISGKPPKEKAAASEGD